MKKSTYWIWAALFAALLLVSLCGCLDSTPGETKKIGGGEDAPAQTAAQTEENAESTEKAAPREASVDEQVCFAWNGLTVTATGLVEEEIWGTGLKLLAENGTDKNYTVGARAVAVNNCMTSDLFSCSVAAGKKKNDTLHLSDTTLKAAGITEVGQIEIWFYVYDSDTWKTVYEPECVTIKTSLFDSVDMTPDDSGFPLYDKDGVRIIGKYVDEDGLLGASVVLFLENKTERNLCIQCDDFSVNGFMVSSVFSSSLRAGKYAVDDITVFSSDLKENGIESIDSVELKFKVIDEDSYKTLFTTDAVSFTAK